MLALVAIMLAEPAAPVAMSRSLFDHRSFVRADCPWQAYAPRDEIRPRCRADAGVSRAGEDGSLRIDCQEAVQYGGWVLDVASVEPDTWYHFDAYYRAEGVPQERRAVIARLDWRKPDGERAGQPDYAYHVEDAGDGWRHLWALVPAPADAADVRVELLLAWTPGGTVWWDDISLAAADPPKARVVRVATIRHRPQGNSSPRENVEEFCAWIERASRHRPDIICLPEGMTMVGTGLTYAEAAEPIPGPTSQRLGEMARKHNCYLVACYNEREGRGIYNTAILLDRQGRLVGKYRKLYVPREEIEGGVTPGEGCPVFDTDFGRIGMMICWDVQYVEPTQRLALNGAEIVFLPIWGGNETLMKARAIENHLFLVSCGYDAPSWIIDPQGQVLAEAAKNGDEDASTAVAEIDLNRRYLEPWLGDMRARLIKEHRDDIR